MCPDPQLFSIYIDGEMPSPWKEKMESHLSNCSMCRDKLENLTRLHELFKKDISEGRIYVEKNASDSDDARKREIEIIEGAKARIWRKLESKRRYKRNAGLWRRRLSVPLPAAAAAAVIIALLAMFLLRGGRTDNSGFAQQTQNSPYNFLLAAEDEFPGIIPTSADISDILKALNADGNDIIILSLPESRNFSRTGDPMIINAAEYPRR